MLRHELYRAFHSKEWWISLSIGMTIVIIQYFMTVVPAGKELEFAVKYEMIPHSVFSKWIGADGATFLAVLYFFSLPLLVTIPFGAVFYKDMKSGYHRMMFLRNGRRSYLLSQYTAVFLSGVAVIMIPLLFNLFITAAALPSIKPVLEAGYFPIGTGKAFLVPLFYSDPYIYAVIYIIIDSLFAGVTAGAALAAAPFAENTFMVIITPFLLMTGVGALARYLGHPELASLFFLDPRQPAPGVTWYGLLICFLFIGILSFLIYYKKGLTDDIF